jgi:hypothetical protein
MSSAAESKDPPLLADPQDPLPESGFLYRRITVWVVSLIILALLWFIVVTLGKRDDATDGLVTIAKWLIGLFAMVQTYYLIAPSAEHIVRIMQTVNAWKSGISTSVMSKVDAVKGTAETKTIAGPAAKPDDPTIPDYARP